MNVFTVPGTDGIFIPGWGWYCNRKFPNAVSAYFGSQSQVVACMENCVLKRTKQEAEAALRMEWDNG